jgi:hypothetical protein
MKHQKVRCGAVTGLSGTSVRGNTLEKIKHQDRRHEQEVKISRFFSNARRAV